MPNQSDPGPLDGDCGLAEITVTYTVPEIPCCPRNPLSPKSCEIPRKRSAPPLQTTATATRAAGVKPGENALSRCSADAGRPTGLYRFRRVGGTFGSAALWQALRRGIALPLFFLLSLLLEFPLTFFELIVGFCQGVSSHCRDSGYTGWNSGRVASLRQTVMAQ